MKKKDIKYLGVPNICFSLTKKNDDREKKFSRQRVERGFDDSETWSLTDTIANFIIPRLKRYDEIASETIKRDDELVQDTQDAIKALELIVRDDGTHLFTDEEYNQVKVGLDKFSKIFMGLWW